jgi:hypothetical protein
VCVPTVTLGAKSRRFAPILSASAQGQSSNSRHQPPILRQEAAGAVGRSIGCREAQKSRRPQLYRGVAKSRYNLRVRPGARRVAKAVTARGHRGHRRFVQLLRTCDRRRTRLARARTAHRYGRGTAEVRSGGDAGGAMSNSQFRPGCGSLSGPAEDVADNGPAWRQRFLDLTQHPIFVEPVDGAVSLGIEEPSI